MRRAPPSAFDRWLIEEQLEPTFRAQAFLRRAVVFIVPRLWSSADEASATHLVLAYSAHDTVDVDGTFRAIADDHQDPNLPPGVALADLHQPIAPPRPFALCTRECFRDGALDPDEDGGNMIDAYAVYARCHAHDGRLVIDRLDEAMSEAIDRLLATRC